MIHLKFDILINSSSQNIHGRTMAKEKEEATYPPTVPKTHERKEDLPWPLPSPLPGFPTEDAGRILRQILYRLDAIEKRLENIEKMLAKSQHTP
jgi:hypothetical protein